MDRSQENAKEKETQLSRSQGKKDESQLARRGKVMVIFVIFVISRFPKENLNVSDLFHYKNSQELPNRRELES